MKEQDFVLLYFRRTDRVTARHSEMQHKLSSLFARLRYGGRGKAGRSRLLDEICVLCGYERKYASKLLGGRRPIAGESGKCRGDSQRIYAAAEREVIKAIWLSAEQPRGKRLTAALPLSFTAEDLENAKITLWTGGGKGGENELEISATCCDPKEITIQRSLDYFTK